MAATKEKKVLAYDDFVLYESDLQSLTGRHAWLTDNIVSFAATYISDHLKNETKENICIVLPSLCQMIKLVDASNELAMLLESFGIRADRWCFFLLNDNMNPDMAYGGSHWILVVYDPTKKHIGVLDSMARDVDDGTRQFARRLNSVLGTAAKNVGSLPCPKMANSGDCGMFTIEYLKAYLEGVDGGSTEKFKLEHITDAYIDGQRKKWTDVIHQLASEH